MNPLDFKLLVWSDPNDPKHLFRHLVTQVLDSDNVVLAAIALKGGGFIESIKKRNDVQLVELVESRREALVEEIVREIEDLYAQGKS